MTVWQYLVQWGHMYVVHFGFWVTFGIGMTIYKNGLPAIKDIPSILRAALLIAAILSVFSSHSQHFLKNIVPDTSAVSTLLK